MPFDPDAFAREHFTDAEDDALFRLVALAMTELNARGLVGDQVTKGLLDTYAKLCEVLSQRAPHG